MRIVKEEFEDIKKKMKEILSYFYVIKISILMYLFILWVV